MNPELPPHLVEHFEDPYNYGPIDRSTHQAECRYEACPLGTDLLVIQLRIGQQTVDEVGFDGEACPWCQASTSLIIEQLAGEHVDALQDLMADPTWIGEEPADGNSVTLRDRIRRELGDIPMAHRGCVRLALKTIRSALESGEQDQDGPTFSGPSLGDEQ
jgi:NifU-like protein involved in Fe-S cluster formation